MGMNPLPQESSNKDHLNPIVDEIITQTDNIIIQNIDPKIYSRGEKINEITTNRNMRNNNEIKRKNRRDETKGK